jgi:hypothetical protein
MIYAQESCECSVMSSQVCRVIAVFLENSRDRGWVVGWRGLVNALLSNNSAGFRIGRYEDMD